MAEVAIGADTDFGFLNFEGSDLFEFSSVDCIEREGFDYVDDFVSFLFFANPALFLVDLDDGFAS